jgi:Tfp pilus assembly protein PilW
MKPRFSVAGFTLVEVVWATVILVLVLGAMYNLLDTGRRAWELGEQQVEMQQNVRVALNRIVQELRKAKGVASSPVSNSGNLYLTDPEENTVWIYLHPNGDLRRAVRQKGGFSFTGHNPVAASLTQVEFIYNRAPVVDSSLVTVKIVGTDPQGRLFSLMTGVKIRSQD